MKYLPIAMALLAAAVVATIVRYGSLSPCDWMEQDLVQDTGLPPFAVRARIQAGFLIKGITDPGPYDCVIAWWRFRADGLPEGS